MTIAAHDAIYIGVNEADDPLPEEPCNLSYRIFCGNCNQCGFPGRILAIYKRKLVLFCEKCHGIVDLFLPEYLAVKTEFVYWCSHSRFFSDQLVMNKTDLVKLENFINSMGPVEPAFWAVKIVSGVCVKAKFCNNSSCIYWSRDFDEPIKKMREITRKHKVKRS